MRQNGPQSFWLRLLLEKNCRQLGNADTTIRRLNETHGKCAYCESKLTHVAYGDIEHIIPKASAPERTYEWENLTTACDICNTNKSDKDGMVDPYRGDPEQMHFRFMGPMLTIVPGSEPAKLTLTELDLNRTSLMEKRKERLEDLGRRLEEILTTRDDTTRAALIEALVEGETTANKEFSACARAYISDKRRDGAIPTP